jgi:hypothetical protein
LIAFLRFGFGKGGGGGRVEEVNRKANGGIATCMGELKI